MRDYKEQVRERVYQWLETEWEKGGEAEIVRAHSRWNDYCDFEKRIINNATVISDILGEDLRDHDEALEDIIANGYALRRDICLDPNVYYKYMTIGNYAFLDLIIREKYIPVVLYDALNDIIDYYNDLEDMK